MSEQPEAPVDEVVEDTEAISEANEDADIDAPDVEDVADEVPRRRLSGDRKALIAAGLVVAALTGLTGWLGWGAYQQHQAQVKRNLFVQVARQGAVNLTTIDHTEIEADVQRILDLATGAFRDDFEHRSKPFMELVKAAQSKSEGTVVDAGLESEHGNSAQVLVAVAVKSRTAGGEEAPREWRMRIEVTSVGDDARMSNVVFVP